MVSTGCWGGGGSTPYRDIFYKFLGYLGGSQEKRSYNINQLYISSLRRLISWIFASSDIHEHDVTYHEAYEHMSGGAEVLLSQCNADLFVYLRSNRGAADQRAGDGYGMSMARLSIILSFVPPTPFNPSIRIKFKLFSISSSPRNSCLPTLLLVTERSAHSISSAYRSGFRDFN